ncbi:MAG: hypothetical protein KF823_00700 [Xanthomonadales bacterium]|nr:hypothetical protein [Xanthomonadales bacterium]
MALPFHGSEVDVLGNLVITPEPGQTQEAVRHYGYDALSRLTEVRDANQVLIEAQVSVVVEPGRTPTAKSGACGVQWSKRSLGFRGMYFVRIFRQAHQPLVGDAGSVDLGRLPVFDLEQPFGLFRRAGEFKRTHGRWFTDQAPVFGPRLLGFLLVAASLLASCSRTVGCAHLHEEDPRLAVQSLREAAEAVDGKDFAGWIDDVVGYAQRRKELALLCMPDCDVARRQRFWDLSYAYRMMGDLLRDFGSSGSESGRLEHSAQQAEILRRLDYITETVEFFDAKRVRGDYSVDVTCPQGALGREKN